MIAITSSSQFDSLINSPKLTLVDFYADWCGPCKAIAPRIEALALEYPSVQFCKVNVDNHPDISGKYGVSAMPTFVFFKKGSQMEKIVGGDMGKILSVLRSNSSAGSGGISGKGRVLGSGKEVNAPNAGGAMNAIGGIPPFYLVLALFVVYLYFNKGS